MCVSCAGAAACRGSLGLACGRHYDEQATSSVGKLATCDLRLATCFFGNHSRATRNTRETKAASLKAPVWCFGRSERSKQQPAKHSAARAKQQQQPTAIPGARTSVTVKKKKGVSAAGNRHDARICGGSGLCQRGRREPNLQCERTVAAVAQPAVYHHHPPRLNHHHHHHRPHP